MGPLTGRMLSRRAMAGEVEIEWMEERGKVGLK